MQHAGLLERGVVRSEPSLGARVVPPPVHSCYRLPQRLEPPDDHALAFGPSDSSLKARSPRGTRYDGAAWLCGSGQRPPILRYICQLVVGGSSTTCAFTQAPSAIVVTLAARYHVTSPETFGVVSCQVLVHLKARCSDVFEHIDRRVASTATRDCSPQAC